MKTSAPQPKKAVQFSDKVEQKTITNETYKRFKAPVEAPVLAETVVAPGQAANTKVRRPPAITEMPFSRGEIPASAETVPAQAAQSRHFTDFLMPNMSQQVAQQVNAFLDQHRPTQSLIVRSGPSMF